MILTDCTIGARVVYTPPGCGPQCTRTEHGVITSINDTWALVRYDGDQHSKATLPRHLSLAEVG